MAKKKDKMKIPTPCECPLEELTYLSDSVNPKGKAIYYCKKCGQLITKEKRKDVKDRTK